ncbi:MogA/MoaB family molybdenum cofactor biosynthesis protein [Candidatus Aminicenantes bacterium AC-708-M15]|jgi:molybdenum cofactor synthesis domain-containing protein|nr:MogA/MoaB family molybdenum cofactor biosynthesis protein [SCandidatus Aminicenantes bacterium Aminicenantia_JdfR_composite]MCP2597250.1 MogA/MoaB family molybdenum cofactor biosynthesis protein [Candidatus Aminicenantes bacterium AC-335-G13]MCP2604197.1 MogA/MoaB family molybdenum cofactor biosynthesis protein [Candidatus Aminicenantes bacterium AC-708-M15]MCP2618736.1 MogA/MoaB family molybdenum cofactor biosynthesis protein [Candidatus Aminicenantes bacterium AC-335-A11]
MLEGIRFAILTISDRSYKGERKDKSGPLLRDLIVNKHGEVKIMKIIPDEKELIEKELKEIADKGEADIILTTGGTGFSLRDVTPEATKAVIEKEVPGLPEAMRFKSMEVTPHAMLSRGVAGIRKRTLIVNLPGSPKGAKENLEIILPALKHGIEILKGISNECAEN